MIESGSNRMDCKFVQTREQALIRNTDPRMKKHLILSEDLSIVFMNKKCVQLNQSWAVGFSILEISKYIMQTLMYKAVKPEFGGQVSTILSDTDSWILAFPTKTADVALKRLKDIMDFSNYDPSHRLFNSSVKNLTGYLKNEIPTDTISEVVGVRSKCYAVKTEKSMSSRCKGVKEATKNKIPFAAFVEAVKGMKIHSVTQYTIQSKSHVNRLMQCKKTAFSSFDDKRHLLCGIHSVPYGSRLIDDSKKINQCIFCAFPYMLC